MNWSHPSVHPVEAPPLIITDGVGGANNNNNAVVAGGAERVRMKDVQGMPGTSGGLILRICQFVFAASSLSIMASTSDFISVTAFCYLVAAVGLQCLWSLSLALVDIYALLVRRCLRNCRIVSLFAIGDGITSTLTFAAACASAGITVLISNDLGICGQNHCTRFETATAMAFISWCAAAPSFLLNFWSLASR
ncbi:hypothetical protein IFM89_034816 [Coptis chinensis]|uniref:CASP-like protein n=1 Tax=Coptis chinensis TaxID=261450 RepID=A0A835LGM1_9MAGN|nr:hypothetical protein IFM89_034816 [Coptis chinensis]